MEAGLDVTWDVGLELTAGGAAEDTVDCAEWEEVEDGAEDSHAEVEPVLPLPVWLPEPSGGTSDEVSDS